VLNVFAPDLISHHLAYIDPGTGSFALQIAIASALGLLYTVKNFWRNICGRFVGHKNSDSNNG